MSQGIAIETAYNVILNYTQASVWDRMWAFLLDSIIKIGYAILAFSLIMPNLEGNGMGIFIAIALLPYIFYSLAFEIFTNGQTPGKLAMNIRVISLDGNKLTVGQIGTRWMFRIVDFFIFGTGVAFLSVLATEKGQRIGDVVANTSVISERRRQTVQNTAYVRLKKDYVPQYLESRNLNESQIELIKSVVQDRSPIQFELLKELADKVQDLLDVEKTDSSIKFLKTIVRDYNYYMQKDNQQQSA